MLCPRCALDLKTSSLETMLSSSSVNQLPCEQFTQQHFRDIDILGQLYCLRPIEFDEGGTTCVFLISGVSGNRARDVVDREAP